MTNLQRFSTGLVLPFTHEDESEIKISWFGHVSGDFESTIILEADLFWQNFLVAFCFSLSRQQTNGETEN